MIRSHDCISGSLYHLSIQSWKSFMTSRSATSSSCACSHPSMYALKHAIEFATDVHRGPLPDLLDEREQRLHYVQLYQLGPGCAGKLNSNFTTTEPSHTRVCAA